jgi:putative spermidine/putrescine transport system permease protein
VKGRHGARLLAATWLAAVYAFLLVPLLVVAGASLNGGPPVAYVSFPPEQLALDWYRDIPPSQFRAIGLSLGLATVSALVASLLGVPAALGLVRARFPGKTLVGALLRAPLQIPLVVIGVAFLQLYHLVGDWTGVDLAASFPGLVTAHTFAGMPYVIGATAAVLQRFDLRLEEAAVSLGASRWSTMRRVTLPVIAPGVYTGALYAFMLSFTDVPMVLFLAGPGFTTFPVEVFHTFQFDFDPTVLASSTLVMGFSLVMLVAIQRLTGLDTLLRSGGVAGGR